MTRWQRFRGVLSEQALQDHLLESFNEYAEIIQRNETLRYIEKTPDKQTKTDAKDMIEIPSVKVIEQELKTLSIDQQAPYLICHLMHAARALSKEIGEYSVCQKEQQPLKITAPQGQMSSTITQPESSKTSKKEAQMLEMEFTARWGGEVKSDSKTGQPRS